MPRWTKEQEEAIKRSGENIIVSAGAGSGKTAVLTARVVDKLKQGIHIEELLIMTFTSAAAEEMKTRIREELKKLPELSRELINLDQAYITTFDSFSLSVLKKYHYVLGLDKDINIAESSLIEMKKQEFMDSVFISFYEKSDEKFLKMVGDFCVRDDDNLRSSVLSIANSLELRWDLEEYLDNYISSYYKDETINSFLFQYDEFINNAKMEVKANEERLYNVVGSDYASRVSELLKNIYEVSDYNELKSILSLRLPNLPKNSSEEEKSCKEELSLSIKNLKNYLEYGDRNRIIENFYKSQEVSEVIVSILKEYYRKLNEYKRKEKIYDFIDIAKMSINIVERNSSIRDEIRASFKEILVDEYQDTNDLQEKFVSLISDNNVYMVGDVKQSIYRFRNANPNIFREKYNNYSKHDGGYKIDLLSNFRSRKEVLDDINKIFRQVMDDNLGGADYIASHQMVFGNTAYDTVGSTKENSKSEIWQYNRDKNSEFSNEEIEATFVVHDIMKKIKSGYKVYDKKNSIREVNYSDFTILIDRASSFDLYKKIFNYFGVPITLYKDENLGSSEEVYLLSNIIEFVISIKKKDYGQSFKRNFVSIARSFLYSLSDDEIFTYIKVGNISDSSIYNDLKRIADIIEECDIYHVIKRIVDDTRFYEKSICIGEEENVEIRVEKLMELGNSLSSLGYDIYEFSSYLRQMLDNGYSIKYSVNSDSKNSVRIMTIHKSKGLDGTICYFTGLYKKFNIRDVNEKFLYSNKYGIIVPYFDEGVSESFLKLLFKESYVLDEVSEKIRLFYVALTRAREKMIFVLPFSEMNERSERLIDYNVRRKYRSLSDIINSLGGSILDSVKTFDYKILVTKDYLFSISNNSGVFVSSEKLEVEELPVTNYKEKVSKHFSKSTNKILSREEISNMEFGSRVHEYLEFIDFKKPLLELIEDEFIRKRIGSFLNSDILSNVKEAQVFKEYEFMWQKDGEEYHGVIDCMLVYDDYVDIIDYKLKYVEDSAYVSQLEGYRDYIKEVTGKRVNTYLYSILDGKLQEISKEEVTV